MSKASMACSPFSHLLRSSIRKKAVCSSGLTLSILQARPSCFFNDSIFRNSPFSTSASPSLQSEDQSTKYPDVKSSLSARMSFVFDQIDALDREKKEKDETLQRIRAWRENKQKKDEPVLDTDPSVPVSSSLEEWGKKDNLFTKKDVELVHPWSEWVEFMEQLVRQNYFDHRRKDEDQIMRELGCDEVSGFAEEGFDFTRDWTTVRTACLNFGRDRFDLLRSLSRKDIQILVGSGCPSTDSKVVFSSKVLRKHAHLDEGDVCSSCNLRSTCNRGFLLTRKEDEARTLDLIRVLLTFGFDPINGSVENKPLMKLKPVKTVARKLLHEIVKLSSVPIDPNLPPPEIKRPPPKIKQPPPQPKKRVGRDDIEMKKGDWLCPKCDFMNFAKNVVCLQCDAKRPKRQLLPGEWECPECNFLNYRRNVVCFHCEHKRPPDDYIENRSLERANVSRARMSDASRIPGITDSYNFDFDDDESDGAEVAAFEFADSPKTATGPLLDDEAGSDGFEGQSFEARGMPRQPFSERGRHTEQVQMTESSTRMGFDDFDDEEEDDVNSYEIDTSNNTYSKPKTSSRTLSDYEEPSGSEDSDDSAVNIHSHRPMRKRARSVSDVDDLDCDSDEELPSRSFQRSANIASSRQKSNIRGRGSYSRSFVSDDEFGLNSDSDDDMGESYTHKWNDGRKSLSSKGPMRLSESEDGLSFGSESEDGDDSHFHRKARNKAGSTTSSRYRSNSGGDMRSTRDAYPRHDRGGSLDGFHDNKKNNGVARGGRYNEQRMTGRGNGASGSYKPGQGGYGNRERGKFDESRGRYNEQRMAGRSGSSSGSYRPGQGAGYGNRGDRGNGRSSGFGDRLGRGNANDRPRDRFGRGNANDRPRDRLGRGNANDGPRRRIIER